MLPANLLPWEAVCRQTQCWPRTGCFKAMVKGARYVTVRYTGRLTEAGIEASVGSRGDGDDNALAETINGLYKTELVHHQAPWKNQGIA